MAKAELGKERSLLLSFAQTPGFPSPHHLHPRQPSLPTGPFSSSHSPPQPQGRGPALGSPDPSCPSCCSPSVPWQPARRQADQGFTQLHVGKLGSQRSSCNSHLPAHRVFSTSQPFLKITLPAALRIKAGPPVARVFPWVAAEMAIREPRDGLQSQKEPEKARPDDSGFVCVSSP